MSLLRSTRLITAPRIRLQIVPNATAARPQPRLLSTTSIRSSSASDVSSGNEAAGHDHYDPPTGWLFGVKPGEKPETEGWENVWFYGFFGSLAFGIVGYCYKPDTSIQTWALEEARRRLEVEGILEDPDKQAK